MIKLRAFLILSFLCLSTLQLFSQYSWLMEFEGSGYVGAEGIATDPDNNLLVIGNFENGVTIAGSTYTGRGSFLLKITKSGTPLWHKIIRYGPGDFWSLVNVEADAQGNFYISGTFPFTATIDGTSISGPNLYNSVIAKLNSDGDLVWTKVIERLQEIYDMRVNESGEVLMYGPHHGTLTIDHVTLEVGSNSFGALFTTDGELQWAKTFGDPQQYTTWPKSCALDNSGNAYFEGIYSNTLSLDGKQITSAGGNYDLFFTRIDHSGICSWLTGAERRISGNETNNPPNGLSLEQGAIQVDNQGNLYGAGIYWQGMKLGTFTLQHDRAFLTKFDHVGVPQWVQTPFGSNGATVIEDIVVRNGRVYFSGLMSSQLFFSVSNPAGDVIQEPVLLPLYADIASSIAVDSEDSVYMSGRRYVGGKLQAFVFKYSEFASPPPPPTLPVAANRITSPATFCSSVSTLTIETSAIAHADFYEWEISYNGQVTMLTSVNPSLELSLTDLGVQGDFIVRVRGVNPHGRGAYSPRYTCQAVHPLPSPQLLTNCNTISVSETTGTFAWYRNNEWLQEYENQTSIQPPLDGAFTVTVSNLCGSITSNVIEFTPVKLETITIPNVITPNNDEWNQFFIVDQKLESPALKVYNRWGKMVFFSTQYANEWDGDGLPSGVYYYQLTSGCYTSPIQGSLSIVK